MSLVSGTNYSVEIVGRRNVIINGNFNIWQRGTSQTTSGFGSDDRWKNENGGSTKVHSQQSFVLGQTDVPNNPIYFTRTIVTSVPGAGNFVNNHQLIEDVRTFAGEITTLSFWAKADATKDMSIEFWQSFGTGGSPSASVSSSPTTISLSTTWQKFTITTTLPVISGNTLGTDNNSAISVLFWFDAGAGFDSRTNSLGQQSGTFDIAQVQFEKGDTATEFEYRTVGEELALCQRYYEIGDFRWDGYGEPANIAAHIRFVRSKRTAPTIVVNNVSAVNISTVPNLIAPFIDGFSVYHTMSLSTGANFNDTFAADAEL